MEGMIFSIDRASMNDGPGIRTTVFLKGCPLRCQWCHNPESQRATPELMFYGERCARCAACVSACPNACHQIEGETHTIHRDACRACGACVKACPNEALEIKGRPMEVEAVLAEALKDRAFYETSGGGLTVSGGEPLMQAAFCRELLSRAKAEGIHTAVETSGAGARVDYESLAPHVDLWLFDFKESDPERHREYTGVGSNPLRDNHRWLDSQGKASILRCPIIPGLNDRSEHFAGIAAEANTLRHVQAVNLMAYHPLGESKCERLGRAYPLPGKAFADADAIAGWKEAISKLTRIPVD